MMTGAEIVDFLATISDDARRTAAQHPLLVPALFMALFAAGWCAPYLWDVVRRHRSATVKLAGVALGGLVIAALAPVVSTSSAVGPPCAFTAGCATAQQAREECSQRHDEWQKWQRCVARRTHG